MDQPAQPASAPQRAGDLLREAREARDLSLAQIAERTRVPQRHLEAIEASDYQSLPSHTYATGFARAFARAVGADEVAIARAVRHEADRGGRRQPEYQPYEAPDPARVPSRGLTAVAVGLAIAVAVLAGLWFATDLLRGGGEGPTVVAVPPVSRPAAPVAGASPTLVTNGQVVLTARDEVWMRVYDGDNKTLYLGTLQPGARFEVPLTANRPQINVGRPDQLAITVNGSAVPPLGDGRRAIKDVPIDAAALLARSAAPAASASAQAPAQVSGATRARPRPRRRPPPALTETQRANLASATQPAAAATPQP